ncbi:hypothetical protein KY345_07055 [Candidatus Woesearchaeota archaeon]|nr:hypothetical protein [Candidatus Woesearchaeota archaeon]
MKYLPKNDSIPPEHIGKAVVFTEGLNEFLVPEIIDPEKEHYGFMRRGKPGNPESRNYDRSAGAFEREAWPYLLRNNSSRVIGFKWHVLYEVGPTFKSTSFLTIGYAFDHDLANSAEIEDRQARLRQIQQKPFFTGPALAYSTAEKKGRLFSSIDEVISYLREFIPTLNYQKRS